MRTIALLLLVSAAPALASDFALDETTLAAAARDVVPAVAKETGVDLSRLSIRIGTRRDIVRTLVTEMTEQLQVVLGDEATARAQALSSATLLSRALLAKYSYDEKVILLCEENLRSLAPMLEEPLLLTAEGVRAILTHECVHAADDRKYGLRAGLANAKSAEALECFSAVMEGHAQVVSRRVCARQGWGEAFAAFTRTIDKVPAKGLDEGQKQLVKLMGAKTASAYHEGERFMRHLEAKGGAAAVDRAFRSPPAELALIENPAWFLDPSARPKPGVDLLAALKKLIPHYPVETWSARTTSLSRVQIRTALNLLPPADIEWVAGTVKEVQALVLNPRAAPMSKMVVAALYHVPSAVDAKRCFGLLRKLSRIKDERMQSGSIRITATLYHESAGDGWSGEFAAKTIQVGPEGAAQEVRSVSLTAHQGPILLEMAWSAVAITEKETIARAIEILGALEKTKTAK